MNGKERRIVLEEIVQSSDRSVLARDRLRALELLDELDMAESRAAAANGNDGSTEQSEHLSTDKVEDEWDERLYQWKDPVYARMIIRIFYGDQQMIESLPRTTAVIDRIVTGKTDELAVLGRELGLLP